MADVNEIHTVSSVDVMMVCMSGITTYYPKVCSGLGRKHVHLSHRGFHPSYWDVFAKATLDWASSWGQLRSQRHCNMDMQKCWARLATFITECMRDGY